LHDALPYLVGLIVVALGFDFLNGLHDAANSIATIVSTRVLPPQYAVFWAASFNFIAFLFFEMCIRDRAPAVRLATRAVRKRLGPSRGKIRPSAAHFPSSLSALRRGDWRRSEASSTRRVPPVSYTHLDVYKRQVWSCGNAGNQHPIASFESGDA